jgi:hypothetical protein
MAQYIHSITMFVVNNREFFTENSKLYYVKTINYNNLFQPQPDLYIKGVLCMLASRYTCKPVLYSTNVWNLYENLIVEVYELLSFKFVMFYGIAKLRLWQ